MSSLFGKLKALISASARGPRRSRKAPTTGPDQTDGEAAPEAEVSEAPARRRKVPEVTEAPQPSYEAPVERRPATQLQEAQKPDEQSEELEEGRIVDMLKDKEP